MKTRNDYITNSSSSSFIISKKHLDKDQMNAIRWHIEMARAMGTLDEKWDHEWEITENEDFIAGYTYMDNFSMWGFMETIGVDPKSAHWDDSPIDLDKFKDIAEREEELIVDENGWRKYLKRAEEEYNKYPHTDEEWDRWEE